ncbi:MAG: hypothetical protein M1823_002977 [Watsoniomyces obsoletus]|nr:MAG: hypothetical protein M1823_002977 [Watsoniomyces obsoletus]
MTTQPAKKRKLGDESTRERNTWSERTGSNTNDGSIENSNIQKNGHRTNGHSRSEGDQILLSNGSFKSTLFKLQIEELLENVKWKQGRRAERIGTLLRQLKIDIENKSERGELSIIEAERQLQKRHGVAIPFPEPRPGPDAKYKLAYAKPAGVNVVGSYALGTVIKTQGYVTIDSIFQEKDYLNYRYFHKRAYYLACLAAGIKDSKSNDFEVKFDCLNGNPLQPVLSLTPKSEISAEGAQSKSLDLECVIRVLPIISEKQFPVSKLLPSKNCVRRGDDASRSTRTDQDLPPTPFYNASLRSDSAVNQYLRLFHDASARCEAFKEACILGRLWLRQRGLGGEIENGGFGHFEWASMMALLLQGDGPKGHKVLSPEYSSYQLFKAMLQFLAGRDLTSKPMIVRTTDVGILKSDGPTLLDGETGVNILFKMAPWSYKLLRRLARISLEMLNDPIFNYFDQLFIVKADRPLESFDMVARLPFVSIPSTTRDAESSSMRLYRKIYTILKKGLGDRVEDINLAWASLPPWPIKTAPKEPTNAIEVRIVLDPANAGRSVDHGPSAENKKEAAAFRAFWGEKAELRRFKDGSIIESLIWAGKTELDVTWEIVSYLFKRHLKIEPETCEVYHGAQLGELLPGGLLSVQQNMANYQPLMTAASNLEQTIRGVEGLPLQLRQILSASSTLTYTSLYPLAGPDNQHSPEPADLVIQFEGSGRWPDDLLAIQRTKIALLLKVGDLLGGAIAGVKTRLGLENEEHPSMNAAFLDVIFRERFVFRLRIQNEREETLNERRLKDKSVGQHAREEAAMALSAYKRQFVQLPAHAQIVRTLCTRFPFLSQTIRLMKRWFDSHLLSLHFSEQFIELLVIRTFVQSHPWSPPSSIMTGFLRSLLFLSRWDWRVDPLVVNISGEMSSGDFETINTRFEAWRKIDPGMNRVVLFAASTMDMEGVTWTQEGPSKVVATRMTTLARSAVGLVHEAGLELDITLLISQHQLMRVHHEKIPEPPRPKSYLKRRFN